MLEALSYTFFQRALLAGLLASIACGILGSFVVVKRISAISGGMAHACLGGVGLGCFFGFDPFLGAAAVAVVFGGYIGRVYLRQRESLDTLISVVWSFGMALGVLLISLAPGYAPDLASFLFGSILLVSPEFLVLALILDVVILLAVGMLFHRLQAVAFDEEFAHARGMRVEPSFILLLVLVSLTVVALIKVVGLILVIALLTIPAVIARQWSTTLPMMMLLASGICAASVTAGLLSSYLLSARFSVDAPSGPMIILLAIALYLASSSVRALQSMNDRQKER